MNDSKRGLLPHKLGQRLFAIFRMLFFCLLIYLCFVQSRIDGV